MVTTKTVDRLTTYAQQLSAIAEFLYEQGYREESKSLIEAGIKCMDASCSILAKIQKYHNAVNKDN